MRKAAGILIAMCALAGGARADAVSDFYQGKTVNLYIGYGPGGAYDTYSRLLARYMPSHLPGTPTFVPQNMPGASSMRMANFLARVAPKDGTAFGAVNSALIFDPLFAGARSQAQFKGPDMTMIGNVVSSASVLVAWAATGVKTLDDVRERGLTIGATSPSGDTYLLPLSVKNILGLDRLKIVIGYPGTREAALALEQGEISGRVWDMEGIKASRPDWLRDGKINIVAQLAPQKMPEVPAHVPLIKDYVKNPAERAALDVIFMSTVLARPYIAPEGIPAERVKALRSAFIKALEDPELLAEAKKRDLTIDPTSGERMQQIIDEAYRLPAATVETVRRALTTP
jgi:tripartite-type tricarboxylate transporter receptor subunit TctC